MDAVLGWPQQDAHVNAASGVADGILHRVEAREIDGGGDRLRQRPERLHLDLDDKGRARDRGAQARREPTPFEQRRVDPSRELA